MVLDSYRGWADRYLEPAARRLSGIRPNTLSLLSLLCAAGAGVLLALSDYRWELGLAALLIGLNAFLDAVDGRVARMRGLATPKGDFVDHVFDRYADVFILLGFLLSPLGNDLLGLFALLGVLLTSYMGVQAQAVGIGRDYRGVLGRADRLVILFFAPLIEALLWLLGFQVLELGEVQFTIFDLVLWYFALAGNLTAIQRAYATYRALP